MVHDLREANKVSRPVFARYLNTSGSAVEKTGSESQTRQRDGVETAFDCPETWVAGAGVILAPLL